MKQVICGKCGPVRSTILGFCPNCKGDLRGKEVTQPPVEPTAVKVKLIDCQACGSPVSEQASACPKCGQPVGTEDPARRASAYVPAASPAALTRTIKAVGNDAGKLKKNRGVYVILGLFFGTLGIHNFYAGRFGVGAVQLLYTILLGWMIVTLVPIWIWNLVELFVVTEDGQGLPMG